MADANEFLAGGLPDEEPAAPEEPVEGEEGTEVIDMINAMSPEESKTFSLQAAEALGMDKAMEIANSVVAEAGAEETEIPEGGIPIPGAGGMGGI